MDGVHAKSVIYTKYALISFDNLLVWYMIVVNALTFSLLKRLLKVLFLISAIPQFIKILFVQCTLSLREAAFHWNKH